MRECLFCQNCYEDSVLHCPQDQQRLPDPLPWPLIIAGKYQINALIGRGGMSAVYRATQLELARSVAIKVLLPEAHPDASAPERFRREALASARIDHPNVVTIYDYGSLPNGAGYLAMRLLRGHSLSREIRTYRQLSFERVMTIMFQICSAIDTAHRLGIVHCDLKPDNIILEDTEIGEIVQILDFGIAKLMKGSKDQVSRVTLSGVVLGTPLYMSPEQCESRELDLRTDIYSLGIILYEMLTGSLPFTGDSSTEIANNHLKKPVPPPSQLRSQITPKLEQAILKALAKPRDARFQSAAEFLDALKEAAQELAAVGRINTEQLPQIARNRATQKLPSLQELLPHEDQPTIKVSLDPLDNIHITESTISPLTETGQSSTTGSFNYEQQNTDSSRTQTVLIIDDEPSIQILLEQIVLRLGCRVLIANHGLAALEMLKVEEPDLIISDVMMPFLDGYQLYEELQKDAMMSVIPLIFLTARAEQDEKLQALERGVEDYWTKPFDVAEVTLRLQRILQRIQRLKRLERRNPGVR